MSTSLPATSQTAEAAATPRVSDKKRILVLGATSGIAEATCRIWAGQGSAFFLVARNVERLAAVASDLRVRGASYVDTAIADLDDTDSHPLLLAGAVKSLDVINIAYVTSGLLGDQSEAEQDFHAADRILHSNFVVPVSLLTWLANYCVKRRAGVLAVISSVAGDRGRKSNYIYGSSKAGLTAFLGGLRNRVDREGVTVLTIKPGPVRTAMTNKMKGAEKFADVDEVAQAIAKAIDNRTDNLYVPFRWGLIMVVIRSIPERFFKKLNL